MTKRAVVLGGGGARGPYQIGVWEALRELEISYDIVTGTSVGALNGAMMVQGDFELAKKMWENLTMKDVVVGLEEYNPSQLIPLLRKLVESGGLDTTPLENTVRATINEDLVRASPIEYGLVTSRYPTLKTVELLKEEIPQGELVDYMLASASWFPFFRRKTIDGVDYIDGGYADNLPAKLALRCGAEEVIAVDIQGTGIIHSFRAKTPVTYIRCHWDLGDMMAFDTRYAARSMRLGRLDALRAWKKLEGAAYAFPPGATRDNAFALRLSLARIRLRTGISFFRDYKRLPHLHLSLRYHHRDRRFVPMGDGSCSPGKALTAAAEITGELLRIPPDKTYALPEFNKLLLSRVSGLLHGEIAPKTEEPPPIMPLRPRSRLLLARLYRLLRDSYLKGSPHDALRRAKSLYPMEFAAAYYLLAVQLSALRQKYGRQG